MRLFIRHLSTLCRSRRRVPFLFLIGTLLSIGFVLYLINHNQQTENFIKQTSKIADEQLKTANKLSILVPKTSHIQKKGGGAWPIDEKGRSLKNHFLVLDLTGFFGGGASEGEQVQCPSSNTSFTWTRQQNRVNEIDFLVSHDAQGGGNIPFDRLQLNENQQQYSMAFVMESEVHSSTGDGWAKFNFIMTYDLDNSYPEPATYFDMNIHLIDLLRPPSVPFDQKDKDAYAVWIISNCNAHNGRQDFVGKLMNEIKIDSYGSCLNNKKGYSARMVDNANAYKKYKFVIAIENSNCFDYVTEKLVKAVEGGSIPIVAGYNNRSDYRRYMPKHSFINIFDYKTIKELADDIKRIGNNKTLYESYLWYKNHSKNIEELKTLSLNEKLKHFADVVGANATMITNGIAGKERSENKICKLTRFVRQTPWQDIAAHKKIPRTDANTACLPGRYILTHFKS
ncbi:unnamed protein product [Adineta steineri]|uniref:Fucosyltransferase n=1 Tax=Adineta steineri TaxID=433720 RepID=A0A813XQD2_9BILA|nr:unnamed protein product [Adineta steineri]CAF3627041.1 unnamed protein product [Adineta steineri]